MKEFERDYAADPESDDITDTIPVASRLAKQPIRIDEGEPVYWDAATQTAVTNTDSAGA